MGIPKYNFRKGEYQHLYLHVFLHQNGTSINPRDNADIQQFDLPKAIAQ